MPSAAPRLALWASIPIVAALGGCAIPPVVTIASLAINAASYASTGKSVSDHGISAVMGEDCALWRVVADRKVCEADPAAPAVAAAQPESAQASAPVELAAAAPFEAPTPAPAPELASVPQTRRFLVLGSFLNAENARHLAASLEGIETAIVIVGTDGATFHRVIAGPLDDRAVEALSARMALEAGARPWEIPDPAGEAPELATPVATGVNTPSEITASTAARTP